MSRMVSPVCMCVMLVRTVVVAFVVVVVHHLLQVVVMIMAVVIVVVVLRAVVGHVLLALGEQGHAEEAEAVTNHQTPHLERCFQITHRKKMTKPPVLADHTFHAFMAIDIVNFASYYMSIRFV